MSLQKKSRPLHLLPATLALLAMLTLPGCFVYKIDIQQGNEITTQMLSRLKIGMSQEEVGQILGFPLITDPFHAERWDYYFYLKKGKTGEVTQQYATLHFTEESLSKIESSLTDSDSTDGTDSDSS